MINLREYILDDCELVNQLDFDSTQALDTKISFNIMVKDEERCIARCLDSIIELADEIIIADTGSQDDTLKIISHYNSKKIKLFHFSWGNDFSAVRNFMLEQSSYSTIFQLDADEYIDDSVDYKCTKKVIALLLNSLKDQVVIAPLMRDATGCVYPKLERIFHFENNNFFYRGNVHEELNNRNITFKAIQIKLPIIHDGYLEDIIIQKNKSSRNIDLLKLMLEKNELYPRWQYFMAKDMYYANYPIEDILSYANRALEVLSFENKHLYYREILQLIIAQTLLDHERYSEFEQALEKVNKKYVEYYYFQLLYLHKSGFDKINESLTEIIASFNKLEQSESFFNSNLDHIYFSIFWLYLQLFYFDEAKNVYKNLNCGKDQIKCKLEEIIKQIEMIIDA